MENIKKSARLIIGITGAVLLVGLAAFASLSFVSSNSRDNQDPAKQKEMMALLLEWGRLAPFPASATGVSIQTEGNLFTRSFHARFVAPEHDIKSWIEDSPGLHEALPEELDSNIVQYVITPGGGANKAEVIIDYAWEKVDIYVSWD